MLEAKTLTFTVTRHIRPKKRCTKCSAIVQAPAPSRPIEKSFAGASLLAPVLSWKYSFHLPLYRQCQIFAHARLQLSRTTLMQWVAASSLLLGPLVEARIAQPPPGLPRRPRGQIILGEIPPIRRAALAAQGKKMRVALVGRDGETIAQLLERLDCALGKAMAEDTVIDDVLPEIKRRRAR